MEAGSLFCRSLLLFLGFVVHASWAQRGDIEIPSTEFMRCEFQRSELKIVCSNGTVEQVMKSLRELVPSANDPIQPIQMEIVNSSGVIRLPYVFPRFNRTLKMIRVSSTSLSYVYPDAFAHMARTLVRLDLSRNQLVSLPYALANLTALEFLNLSHNRIFVFDGSKVFRSPLNLLTLDISNNALGLSGLSPDDDGNYEHPEVIREVISESHVSFGDAVSTVQYLDMSKNGMASLPQLFLRRQLPYLRVLKLTNNSVSEYKEVLKRFLPRLQKLYLENNNLTWLPSYSIQRSLMYLDYSGNPLKCVCDTVLLRELIVQNNIESYLPKCDEPEKLIGMSVEDIPETLCKSRTTPKPTTPPTTADPTVYLTSKTKLTNVSTGVDSVRVTWTVDYKEVSAENATLKGGDKVTWYALYREFGQKNKTTLKISSDAPENAGNQTYEHVIADLNPITGYVVCFKATLSEMNHYNKYGSIRPPRFCKEVQTIGEQIFPVVEVAVATTVSSSTTMAIVAFCCFCCPKSFWKCKKKKKDEKCCHNKCQQSRQKLFEASETEVETSKSTLDKRYSNTSQDIQIQYIDHKNLLHTQSSPDVTSMPTKTVVEPYLEPIKPNRQTNPEFKNFRMGGYMDNRVSPIVAHQRYKVRRQSTNLTDVPSDSESEDSPNPNRPGKVVDRYSIWQDGKFLNYVRPMSADNVSPSTSSTSSNELRQNVGQFFFPRPYATYR